GVIALALVKQSVAPDAVLAVGGSTAAIDPDDAPLTYDELIAFLRERPGGGDLVVEARADGGPWVRLERLELSGFVTGRVALTLDVRDPDDAPGADAPTGGAATDAPTEEAP
ncbi:MAG: hypothetical protein P1P87_16835, partial [Trueperaceae bacterium]|nr:hypothetical protein [Trueperaceae bacterium]